MGKRRTRHEFRASEPAALEVRPAPERAAADRCHDDGRFRRAFDDVPMGILVEDADGHILEMNPYLRRILGYGPAELGTLASIAIPDDALRLNDLVERLRAGTITSFDMEVQVTTLEHQVRTFRKFGARIPGLAGDKPGVICVLVDVTEQREAERLKNEFVAVVSHELRTPLTMILGPLKMLESGQLDPTSELGREFIRYAVESATYMERLVRDIFDVGRLQSGHLTIRLVRLDLTEFLRSEIDARRARIAAAPEGGPAISVAASPGLMVQADPDRLQQVLTNVFDNAIAYSPPGGQIQVTASTRGGQVRIEVADQGPGVPKDQREKVFERFIQLASARDRSRGGTGLGLTIARQIVELHGGRIWIDEAPGGGARVVFTLPVDRQA